MGLVTCRDCGYDMRAHEPGDACPECGCTERREDWTPQGSLWRSLGLCVVALLVLAAAGLVFVGLSISKRGYDPYLRALVLAAHILFLVTSVAAAGEIHRSGRRDYWRYFWTLFACGLLPFALYGCAIVILALADLGLVAARSYNLSLALNLVSLLGLFGSILHLALAPRMPRLLLSYAMPLAACSTSLLTWIATHFYYIG